MHIIRSKSLVTNEAEEASGNFVFRGTAQGADPKQGLRRGRAALSNLESPGHGCPIETM